MIWIVLVLGVVLATFWAVGLATGNVSSVALWCSFSIGLALIAVALWDVLQGPRAGHPI